MTQDDSQNSHADRRSAQLVLPTLESCESILALGPGRLLSKQVHTQRVLPASVKDHVATVVADLWRLTDDLTLDPTIREAARLMWTLAPRWGWPQPDKQGAARLPPHSRPKLIRAQLQKFAAGEWLSCLDVEAPMEPGHPSQQNEWGGLTAPGLITAAKLEQLRKSAFQQRLSKGWRHLWSYGVPTKGHPCHRGAVASASPRRRGGRGCA